MYRGWMDEQAREEIAAAAAAHGDLGPEYHDALAEGLVERISSQVDQQVDARLAQQGVQPVARPARSSRANVTMGLGSVGLGVVATAVTLNAWSAGSPRQVGVVYASRTFHQVFQTQVGGQISVAPIVLVALIWAVIAVINIAYARHRQRP
jgi:hypothetical protein